MKLELKPDGGFRLDLDGEEVVLFRHLVERAGFIDTPIEKQDAILRMADRILAVLEQRDGPA